MASSPLDPNQIRPATREETLPIALAAVAAGFVSLIVCMSRGYLLLYGDAVAHLAIARRIVDSRNPGLAQLGGVWLPLPHLLMLPFIQRMEWWQNGLAGAWPSLLCYIFGVAGFYRLCRRVMLPRWALGATAFYALNPNLLYLACTAMTEPLFLALLIWATLLTLELLDSIGRNEVAAAYRDLVLLGLTIFAAVFTRYDGWLLGAVVWCIVTWSLWRAAKVRREVTPAYAVFTVLVVAGPLLWLWYNQHFYHDPLDFIRGPYSAAAIDRKTSPPGSPHYREWHNPVRALVFYTRAAQIDTSAWETGFAVMATAVAGLWIAVRRRIGVAALLLWLPLPFYIYSIAYGSVPLFIPQLYPHSYYNARYGMELLPALALFMFLAIAALDQRLTSPEPAVATLETPADTRVVSSRLLIARLLFPVTLLLAVLNSIAMMYSIPLVLKEAQENAVTRVAFEKAIAQVLMSFPPGLPILMHNSDHVGALQDAGIPLKQTLNESDYDSWTAALGAPAEKAAFVIAIAGDEVAQAVAKHPEGLKELTILCTTGQPCARIYESEKFAAAGRSTAR